MGSASPLYPVRKIQTNARSVTGEVAGFGQYESTLERDLMEILRFDPSVHQFTAQPLKIPYVAPDGTPGTYTPDGFVLFKQHLPKFPILYEVKYRADLRKDWRALMPKFRAAKQFCLVRGWRFEVYTERHIRTPYLGNVKFLWPYVERKPSDAMKDHVLRILWDLEQADADLLLYALCRDATNRALMIPVLWHMVAIGDIGCDLNVPLNMRSKLWAVRDC